MIKKQFSLAGGEIDPALHPRTDLAKYQVSLKTLKNAVVKKTGGVQSRPGTKFVDIAVEGNTSSGNTVTTPRLLPFVRGENDNYLLEFANNRLGMTYEGSSVAGTTALVHGVTNITNATLPVITHTTEVPWPGEFVTFPASFGMSELQSKTYYVMPTSSTTSVIVGLDTTSFSTWSGSYNFGTYAKKQPTYAAIETGGSPAFSEYGDDLISTIQFLQVNDLVYATGDYTSSNSAYNYLTYFSRTASTTWEMLNPRTLASPIWNDYPSGSSVSISSVSAAGSEVTYAVTIIDTSVGFESNIKDTQAGNDGTTGTKQTITLGSIPDNTYCNIYKAYGTGGGYGFIGTTNSTTFVDNGITPDFSLAPPESYYPEDTSLTKNSNPARVLGQYQQRYVIGNFSQLDLESLAIFSKPGGYFFSARPSSPGDDDSFQLKLQGKLRHIIDNEALYILSDKGVWIANQDTQGIITPSQKNIKKISSIGSSQLPPVEAGPNSLFTNTTEDVIYEIKPGDKPKEITILANHLFKNKQVKRWAYQQGPIPTVWVVMSDGSFRSLTYVPEQEIWAWAQHETDGEMIDVAIVPEGTRFVPYFLVKRTLGGEDRYLIETMVDREFTDIKDFVGMDCALTYDGRNTTSTHTMTLSGGTDWDYEETLTLTSSTAYFDSDDVGNAIHLTGSDGTIIRLLINGYTSSTVVTGTPSETVPVVMRSAAISNWAKAVDFIGGLGHLEDEEVAVLGDGYVLGSPNNADYDAITVENGSITLDRPYGVVHVGLAFTVDIETLAIDEAPGSTEDQKKLINEVYLGIENTRGVFAGPQAPSNDLVDPLENLDELRARDTEDYSNPANLTTDTVQINIQGTWENGGRVFIRQVDPLPMEVNSISPKGLFQSGGNRG